MRMATKKPEDITRITRVSQNLNPILSTWSVGKPATLMADAGAQVLLRVQSLGLTSAMTGTLLANRDLRVSSCVNGNSVFFRSLNRRCGVSEGLSAGRECEAQCDVSVQRKSPE